MVVWMGGSVLGEISLPEFLGVVVVFSGGWDESVSESNSWWSSGKGDVLDVVVVVVLGFNSGEEGGNGEEFHNNQI